MESLSKNNHFYKRIHDTDALCTKWLNTDTEHTGFTLLASLQAC